MAHMLALLQVEGGQPRRSPQPRWVPRAAPAALELDPSTEDVHHMMEQKAIKVDRDGRRRATSTSARAGTTRSRPRSAWRRGTRLLELLRRLCRVQESLIRLMRRYGRLPLPGIHPPPARPADHGRPSHAGVLRGGRREDIERLTQAYGRVNLSPMGAAAFAGTSVKRRQGVRRLAARVRRPRRRTPWTRSPQGTSPWRASPSPRSRWWT